jgi:hypothetical protein
LLPHLAQALPTALPRLIPFRRRIDFSSSEPAAGAGGDPAGPGSAYSDTGGKEETTCSDGLLILLCAIMPCPPTKILCFLQWVMDSSVSPSSFIAAENHHTVHFVSHPFFVFFYLRLIKKLRWLTSSALRRERRLPFS